MVTMTGTDPEEDNLKCARERFSQLKMSNVSVLSQLRPNSDSKISNLLLEMEFGNKTILSIIKIYISAKISQIKENLKVIIIYIKTTGCPRKNRYLENCITFD